MFVLIVKEQPWNPHRRRHTQPAGAKAAEVLTFETEELLYEAIATYGSVYWQSWRII
jgi:hypothetical protein